MQTEEIVTNETTNEESKDSKPKFKKKKNENKRFSVPFMESVVMDEAAKKLFA